VAADKLSRIDIEVELMAQIEATLFLGLAATVGQEDVWTGILLDDSF
jgi:hypothetical protein